MPDCFLFAVQCDGTPWSDVSQEMRKAAKQGSESVPASPNVIGAAKITAAATLIAAAIGAGWWTMGRDKVHIAVKQVASSVETQQAHTQPQSTSGSGTGVQAGRDVNLNIYQTLPPPSPAASPSQPPRMTTPAPTPMPPPAPFRIAVMNVGRAIFEKNDEKRALTLHVTWENFGELSTKTQLSYQVLVNSEPIPTRGLATSSDVFAPRQTKTLHIPLALRQRDIPNFWPVMFESK